MVPDNNADGAPGHGFKLAPAVGKVLAQSVLGNETDVDITSYRLARFAEGELLTGAYGIGSISRYAFGRPQGCAAESLTFGRNRPFFESNAPI